MTQCRISILPNPTLGGETRQNAEGGASCVSAAAVCAFPLGWKKKHAFFFSLSLSLSLFCLSAHLHKRVRSFTIFEKNQTGKVGGRFPHIRTLKSVKIASQVRSLVLFLLEISSKCMRSKAHLRPSKLQALPLQIIKQSPRTIFLPFLIPLSTLS